ncbi:MAG TPA: GNAT family N-acetyltransferase [Rhodanobacteraceae bacterium]|nr:GNAT family N-acetyltransferase [Rhodanobacteraceae bacterium]
MSTPIPISLASAPARSVEVLGSPSELAALRPEWWALWHALQQPVPFLSPSWLLCWARHYAPDRTRAIAVREHGTLVALLPFFNWRGELLLAGTGPSDYGDALIAPGREELAPTLLDALAVAADALGCARIDLQQLSPDSPLLKAPAPQGWQSEIRDGDLCTIAHARGDDGLGCINGKTRRNLRLAQRNLAREGEVAIAPLPKSEWRGAARTLEWLHGRRWRQRGESGKLADPLMCAFMRSVIPDLGQAGLLRFYRLKCDNRPLAAAFVMRCGGSAHFYLTGFDPAWSRYSPGLLTVAAAMRGTFAEGVDEFHFLRGREAYKYRLGAEDRPMSCRALWREGAPARRA